MKISSLIIGGIASLVSVVCIATAPPPKPKSCTITCYEKTPACYVTKTGKDCLEITNVKPSGKKGGYICKLKGCDTTTTYGDDGTSVNKKDSD